MSGGAITRRHPVYGLFMPGLGLAVLLIFLQLCPAAQAYEREKHSVAPTSGTADDPSTFRLLLAALLQPKFWIPAENMKPTLLVGDYFVTKPLSANPELGDVVIFRHPVNGEVFVERILGLPGDRVQMIDGLVHINGTAIKAEPAPPFAEVMERQGPFGKLPRCIPQVAIGAICTRERIHETLPNGGAYDVLNIEDGPSDHTKVFTVPEGHYFMLGDNRDNSFDSRFSQNVGGMGFVPAENLQGQVDRIIFSSAGRSLGDIWSWRADRYLMAVE